MKKIQYWEGLRTIFCLIVVISHICLAFFPNVPRIFISMGNLSVIYFLFLSGGVLSLKTHNKLEQGNLTINNVIKYVFYRYLRLLPVVATTLIFSSLIYALGGIYSNELSDKYNLFLLKEYFPDGVDLYEGVYDAFLGAFYRRPILNTPLWTIKYEFFGVIFVWIIMRVMYSKRYRWNIYVFIIAIFLLIDIYMSCIISGMFLFELMYNNEETAIRIKNYIMKYKRVYLITMFITLFFIILGRFAIYFRWLLMLELYCAIFTFKKIQNILSKDILTVFSKYTFAVYASHWIFICSGLSYIIMRLSEIFPYLEVAIILSILSIPVIVYLGWVMNTFVEKPIDKVTKKIKEL